uniref:Polyprenal reductase n=1 Tax=Corethrella appendiculata TaxID=1370023 RepID=U5EHQ2_9DIPT
MDNLFDLNSFNLVNFLFINLIVCIVILGSLVTFLEKYIPVFITQTFRYGKHAHKGRLDKFVSLLEVPKSWFAHFYLFSAVWSILGFYLTIRVCLYGYQCPAFVLKFLDICCTSFRYEKTSNSTTFIAMFLILLQCIRRFYETHFVQVFSSKIKINLSHYFVGYIHYFGTVVLTLSQSEGFVRSPTHRSATFSFGTLIWTCLFLYAWYHQFKSNLILANLRKNKQGNVVTEEHKLPVGGYFEKISSPHMFFEILMYVALYGILCENTSWIWIFIWVLTNQVSNAWLTHQCNIHKNLKEHMWQ